MTWMSTIVLFVLPLLSSVYCKDFCETFKQNQKRVDYGFVSYRWDEYRWEKLTVFVIGGHFWTLNRHQFTDTNGRESELNLTDYRLAFPLSRNMKTKQFSLGLLKKSKDLVEVIETSLNKEKLFSKDSKPVDRNIPLNGFDVSFSVLQNMNESESRICFGEQKLKGNEENNYIRNYKCFDFNKSGQNLVETNSSNDSSMQNRTGYHSIITFQSIDDNSFLMYFTDDSKIVVCSTLINSFANECHDINEVKTVIECKTEEPQTNAFGTILLVIGILGVIILLLSLVLAILWFWPKQKRNRRKAKTKKPLIEGSSANTTTTTPDSSQGMIGSVTEDLHKRFGKPSDSTAIDTTTNTSTPTVKNSKTTERTPDSEVAKVGFRLD